MHDNSDVPRQERGEKMPDRFARTRLLVGDTGMNRLQKSSVLIFGAGGVGGYAIEALARSGIGSLTIVDGDTVSRTNINRQIIALENTVGRSKVEVQKERILAINPQATVQAVSLFYTPENSSQLSFAGYDYVVDAIDTVAGKLTIIENAKAADVPVISAMGAGNKLDPLAFRVADISETRMCPLARIMRKELQRRGIRHVPVVYSEEQAQTPLPADDGDSKGTAGRPVPGSMAFVPSVMGLIIASKVVNDLLQTDGDD